MKSKRSARPSAILAMPAGSMIAISQERLVERATTEGLAVGGRCQRSRGARARARRRRASRLTDQSLSAPAHAAKHRPPAVPVTVISTPAARRRPLPGRRGSARRPRRDARTDRQLAECHYGDQDGDGVEEEASTPTACRSSQLRKIWERRPRAQARSRGFRRQAVAVPPARSRARGSCAGRAVAGQRWRRRSLQSGHRQPPRQTERRHQRERGERGQHRLHGQDRQLSGNQRRYLGLSAGDERRSAAIRAATPSCPLIRLPSTCMLDAR